MYKHSNESRRFKEVGNLLTNWETFNCSSNISYCGTECVNQAEIAPLYHHTIHILYI
jgi:hypothetical protein